MERKDYNNIIKSMNLSHHWYYTSEETAAELRYGLFEPSNELVLELMEENGYYYLAEVIKGVEYSKNIKLLIIITEYILAKLKRLETTHIINEFTYSDELEGCLQASLCTMYRLLKENLIFKNDVKIKHIIENIDGLTNLKLTYPMLNVFKCEYFDSNIALSDTERKFKEDEESRIKGINQTKKYYHEKYIANYNECFSRHEFLITAIEEGIVVINSDGTIRSPLIEENTDFKIDVNIFFKLAPSTQAFIIEEALDQGNLVPVKGMDLLQPIKPIVKSL